MRAAAELAKRRSPKRLRSVASGPKRSEEQSNSSRNPVSREAASAPDKRHSQRLATWSPPHFEPSPGTVAFVEDWALGEDLVAGVDSLLGGVVTLGLGFAVLVTVRVGAWVTSN